MAARATPPRHGEQVERRPLLDLLKQNPDKIPEKGQDFSRKICYNIRYDVT